MTLLAGQQRSLVGAQLRVGGTRVCVAQMWPRPSAPAWARSVGQVGLLRAGRIDAQRVAEGSSVQLGGGGVAMQTRNS